MANLCGAKTRAGGRCRKPAMPNGRCRYHGGMSTGPKKPNSGKNALKHGIYSRSITEEQRLEAMAVSLDAINEEIYIARIQLSRALDAQALADGQPELDEVIEREISSLVGARREEKSRVRDYFGIIDKLLGRIESLVCKRVLLHTALGIEPEAMDANALTPGAPDEPAPASPIR